MMSNANLKQQDSQFSLPKLLTKLQFWIVTAVVILILFGPWSGKSRPRPHWLGWEASLEQDPTLTSPERNTPSRSQQSQAYEVASIVSYGTIVVLALLSFSAPLLLLYFNQFTDSMQSLLVAVFDETRACTTGEQNELLARKTTLRKITKECLELVNEVRDAGESLSPLFFAVVFNSVLLLLLSVIAQLFIIRSTYSYPFVVRIFVSSIVLGVVSIYAFARLAWGRYPSKRVKLLRDLANAIHAELGGVNESS